MPAHFDKLGALAAALSQDPRAAAKVAREAGFDGLLFDATSQSLDLTELSQTGQREFRHVLSQNGVELIGLRADAGPRGFGQGADLDRIIHHLDRAMQTAAALAAPMVCVDIGPLPPPVASETPQPEITAEMVGAIILPSPPPPAPKASVEQSPADRALASLVDAALAELCARADRYSVILALRSDLAPFTSLAEAIDRARCPWIGVDLDTVALARDAWNIDQAFSKFGPLILHVLARDAILGANNRSRPAPLGQASVHWPEILANLDQAGFHGWITIDPTELTDRLGNATRGLAFLRSALSSR